MNHLLNWNFASVRIHSNAQAAAAATGLQARAFTLGQDIAFSPGTYAPHTPAGRHLLTHELAHVVQQSRGGQVPRPAGEPALESAAMAAATSVAQGRPTHVAGASGIGIARDPAPGATDVQQRLTSAIMEARWSEAAELLNSYNKDAIAAVLATLTQRQIESLHLGAVANGRVGGGAQVATETLAAAPALTAAVQAVQTGGITMKEFSDYTTMTHGDFIDRYGIRRYFQVKSRARDLPPSALSHLFPATDDTLYLHASGLVGTKAQEAGRARTEQLATLDEIRSSALAAGASLAAPLITDDKAQQRALIHLGSVVGDVAGGVAAMGAARNAGHDPGTDRRPAITGPANLPSPAARATPRAAPDPAAIGTALNAAPGQRIFYGNVTGPSAAARYDRNTVTFDTVTTARYVQIALEQLQRTHTGASAVVGSGTHGSQDGRWAGTTPTPNFIEPKFLAEDLATTARPNLPWLGPRSVYNLADPSERSMYDAAERLVQAAPEGQRAAVRAWCFSTLRVAVP